MTLAILWWISAAAAGPVALAGVSLIAIAAIFGAAADKKDSKN
ncbi:MAG: hypothetical protein NTV21_14510 [Planctomycetota bacterium]|nr:hypothetical protein [Planctomycetota bacterium]